MPAKPVIFVPGFPASELWRRMPKRMIFPPGVDDIATGGKREKLIALLSDTGAANQLVAGQPIRKVMMIAKQAESLYDILRRFGYTVESGDNFRAVGWDWRLPIDHPTVQSDLKGAIRDLRDATGQKVVVVLHSTGGLVFRQLIVATPSLANDIDQILAFGVPWAGNLKALHYLTKGEALGFLTAKLSASQVRTIMRASQAAYDLCPPDPVRTQMITTDGTPLDLVVDSNRNAIAPLRETSWMPSSDPLVAQRAADADARLGARSFSLNTNLPITNVCGWGISTETRCTIDGREVSFEKTDEGDGTVAYVSSSWLRGPNVRTLSLPIGVTVTDQIPDPHARLWNSESVERILKQVLEGVAFMEFIHASVDNDDSLDPNAEVRIRIAASDSSGAALPNAVATLHVAASDRRPHAMSGTRLTLPLRRSGRTRANFGSRYFRFRVDVRWDGGEREMPLVIRV